MFAVAKIPLTQGYFALVDAWMKPWIMQTKWCAFLNGRGTEWYAVGRRDGKYTYLHRYIMGCKNTKVIVDHKNRNTLDCRSQNLRMCEKKENNRNRGKSSKPSTSVYKGVCYDSRNNQWQAEIKADGKSYYLGGYSSERDAALAYDAACRIVHGEFASPNIRIPEEVISIDEIRSRAKQKNRLARQKAG